MQLLAILTNSTCSHVLFVYFPCTLLVYAYSTFSAVRLGSRTIHSNPNWSDFRYQMSPGPVFFAKFGPTRATFGKRGPFVAAKIGPGDPPPLRRTGFAWQSLYYDIYTTCSLAIKYLCILGVQTSQLFLHFFLYSCFCHLSLQLIPLDQSAMIEICCPGACIR